MTRVQALLQKATARIIVHERLHVEAALTEAVVTERAVILVSGPVVGVAMGSPWFRHLIADVEALHPQASFATVIDCDSSIGFALAALADGAMAIRLRVPQDTMNRIRDIARQSRAVVDESTQPALDLLFHSDLRAVCRAWLQNEVIVSQSVDIVKIYEPSTQILYG